MRSIKGFQETGSIEKFLSKWRLVISYFVIGCLLSIPRPFPAPIFSASSSKLSCLWRTAATRKKRTINERCRRDHRAREERGRKHRSLLYLRRGDRCRSLSRCEGRTEKWGKWEGKEGREVGSVRFPRSTERRWDDASDVGRLSVGRSTVALRRASPVSLPRRGGGISLARSACNVAIKSRIFLWNGALTYFLMHAMALRKLHSPVLH